MQLIENIKHMSAAFVVQPQVARKIIFYWLLVVCSLIVIMIFLGGLTRLTNSGLSITEWNPISGIIPPLTEELWQIEFSKYQNYPEYIKLNSEMNINEFKFIYIMEFVHRAIGRILGFIYVLPFIFFLLKGYIKFRESFIYFFALLLLIAQGFMGWYMVKSGLISNPYICHYRLGAHLLLAVIFYSIMFYQMLTNSQKFILLSANISINEANFWCRISLCLLIIQMILGAFVAGLDGGLVYNSFPLMGDSFVPKEVWEIKWVIADLSDPVIVQFLHRTGGYVIFIVVSIFCMKTVNLGSNKLLKAVFWVIFSLILQISLGILTIVHQVPLVVALIHQLGAILLLSCLLWTYFLLNSSKNEH